MNWVGALMDDASTIHVVFGDIRRSIRVDSEASWRFGAGGAMRSVSSPEAIGNSELS